MPLNLWSHDEKCLPSLQSSRDLQTLLVKEPHCIFYKY